MQSVVVLVWFGVLCSACIRQVTYIPSLEDVLEEWDDIKDAQKEISYYAEHPEEAEPGKLGEIQECLQESKEQLDENWNSYTQQKTGYSAFSTFDEEMKKVLEWREERKRLLGD